ncbi:unnamed protein product [Arabidopsis thaliana]|uniref:Uncharacterized protein n=1 Tax=Arabidopsis thaliana TaxID=3702 RepID=A0A5S9WM08_ARATH|nr:unnamed protein product [Arabidopsis thaliana]
MASNRRRNTNPSRRTDSTHPIEILTPPTETTIWNKDKYKWTYIHEKTLIQLFDEAIAMNNYTLKNPTAIVTRGGKLLRTKTGITVDPDTSFINASDAWWTEQEFGCKLTKSLNRKPPVFWDVMQRCLVLHDVQSQSQHSARQRREQLIHEHGVDEEGEDYSDSDSGNMPQTEVPETQEEEEVYRATIDDDEIFQNSAARRQQRGRPNFWSTARRGSSAQRSGGSSRVSIGSGSRGSQRRQSFETTIQDIITGFREFQRQSFQQLRPGAFDQDDYDEFKKAEAIFIALNLPKHTRFHWACINALKELVFGLGSDHSFGSPHLGGISSRSPSSVGNNLGGQNSPGFWGPIYPQWGTPPNVAQWGTPPNAPQWGTPPNAHGTTSTNVQYEFSVGGQVDGATTETPPIIQQTSSSGLGFPNYFETGQMRQTPRPGGLLIFGQLRKDPMQVIIVM